MPPPGLPSSPGSPPAEPESDPLVDASPALPADPAVDPDWEPDWEPDCEPDCEPDWEPVEELDDEPEEPLLGLPLLVLGLPELLLGLPELLLEVEAQPAASARPAAQRLMTDMRTRNGVGCRVLLMSPSWLPVEAGSRHCQGRQPEPA